MFYTFADLFEKGLFFYCYKGKKAGVAQLARAADL
jgi:hypothetical protein